MIFFSALSFFETTRLLANRHRKLFSRMLLTYGYSDHSILTSYRLGRIVNSQINGCFVTKLGLTTTLEIFK